MRDEPMLPNWIIAGAPKAATSALFRWIVDHPEACGSTEKETYYFVDPGTHMFRSDRNFRDHGLAGYAQLFDAGAATAKVVLEATPAYFYSETALSELPNLPTRPSFIFVLREPLAQLHSLFSYFQQNWNWIPRNMSFADFIAAAEQGRSDFKGNELAANALAYAWYPEHLRRWRKAVGTDRMLVLLYEELVADNRAVMRRVARELGIDPAFYDSYAFPRENSTYFARSGALQDLNIWIRSRLPQGRLYNAFRSLYHALNTRPAKPQTKDVELERLLADRYAPTLPILEQEFGLDMSRWRAALDAVRSDAPSKSGGKLGTGMIAKPVEQSRQRLDSPIMESSSSSGPA